jgi:co-chaperonin GroES (HSP10)
MSKNNTLEFNIGDVHTKLDIPTLEQCYPGFESREYNTIVAPGKPRTTVGKLGLIHMSQETQEQLSMAVQVGRLIDVSPIAFSDAKWPEGSQPPQVGDVVLFAKYAGGIFSGADGREYRMMKDNDIIGIIPPIDAVKLALAKSLSTNGSEVA